MSDTSPKVIVNQKYTLSLNSKSRDTKINLDKKIDGMINYYSNEEKRMLNIIDYYTGEINKNDTMNLLLENGEYATPDDIEQRKKQIKKSISNSNLWQGIISFNNDYINENIDIRKLEKELMKNILPKYFESIGFVNSKKMLYQASLHTDTDNLHFHYSFIEKTKNFKYDKYIDYKKSGKISLKNIGYLKSLIIHTIEREKIYTPLLTETNKQIDEIKSFFSPNEKNFLLNNKKDLIMEYNILRLGNLLEEENKISDKKIKYNSIHSLEIKKYINDIQKYLKKEEDYNKEISKLQNYFKELGNYFETVNKNLDCNDTDKNKFVEYKQKYIESYIGNAIVNYANKEYKKYKKYNEKDLIQYILQKNYSTDKFNKTTGNVLKSYLRSNKFVNKNKIVNSIKTINNELEEAQREFSNLFMNNENTNEKER